MPVISLNQALIPTLTCEAGKLRTEYCDKELPGLLLEVRSSGTSTFHLRFKSNGKTKYIKIGNSAHVNLIDARRKARSLKAEIELGADPRAELNAKKSVPTLTDFFNDIYLPHAKAHKKSWKRDTQLFVRLQSAFGHLRLNQIEKLKVAVFHAGLIGGGLSEASADHHAKLLRHLINHAIDLGVVSGPNVIARFKLFNPENVVNNIPSAEEQARFLHVLQTDKNRPVCLLAQFLWATGMRLGEATSCRWADVDIPNRVVRLKAENTKGGRHRAVPLSDFAISILEQLGTQGEYEHLFVNRSTGKPLKYVARQFDRIRKAAGLPKLRRHDLRHLAGTQMLEAGVDLKIVQEVLGHRNIAVTAKHYAHVSAKSMQAAAAVSGEVIQRLMQSKVEEAA